MCFRRQRERTHRLDVFISVELDSFIKETAAEFGITEADVLRRGFAVLKAYHGVKTRGFPHLGFVTDPTQLDIEIVNVL